MVIQTNTGSQSDSSGADFPSISMELKANIAEVSKTYKNPKSAARKLKFEEC